MRSKHAGGSTTTHLAGSVDSVRQAQVNVERVAELPSGVPACWKVDAHPTSPDMMLVTLWLLEGLPERIEFWFRAIACREALPGVDFDHFTVTSQACQVIALPVAVGS